MTTTPKQYTVTDDALETGGRVSIASCDQCGALVGDTVAHAAAGCGVIQPPKPEPLTAEHYRKAWAAVVHDHRVRVAYAPGPQVLTIVQCACRDFTGTEFAHSAHVADMIAQYTTENPT
ncbi:hypothetical protein SEA_EVANESCE_78 [Mycobacterium phage Evanesce]|uniref:Uncharacterized protein n=15 Tax=Caudoviricetes TaxID=2731619 RepID=A0A385D1D0_9CAUD|nr:hypothetical protein Giles_72 [Mycobacterium phage Giles]AHY84263.1 hypothetical protein PBI_HH92_78 [Mycobacterium phage HH92]AKQ07853.1 hypothetical protein SEA_KINBOTE_77 [Mycobacterium phage Kinbote]ALA06722.1 hypothetical protein SEA_OBUpride_78 [Mycobacterium phage OBUpride]ALF00299.1 hypothetical protein SEA_EVANESCE_78 [Mycobacterium phage Evanesce]ATN90405.1 hypothetical protein SEA_LILHAZELNUT_79 [Mycobacterium phage LilHazelnut]AXQ51508.1 hypothetical protein SEA_AMOCHICK_80 [My